MLEYLDKINALCQEKEMSLILTITPAVSANIDMCNAVRAYADREGCTFISFNEQNVYRQMDYRMDIDNCDDGHPNIWGAVKVSDYIGGVLSGQIGIGSRTEPQWEATRGDYDFTMDACEQWHAELAGQDRGDYLAVVSGGRVLTEQLASGEAEYQGVLAGGCIPLYARSARTEWGSGKVSVSFGEENYYSENSGLHVVVYNNQTRKMVDHRWFET